MYSWHDTSCILTLSPIRAHTSTTSWRINYIAPRENLLWFYEPCFTSIFVPERRKATRTFDKHDISHVLISSCVPGGEAAVNVKDSACGWCKIFWLSNDMYTGFDNDYSSGLQRQVRSFDGHEFIQNRGPCSPWSLATNDCVLLSAVLRLSVSLRSCSRSHEWIIGIRILSSTYRSISGDRFLIEMLKHVQVGDNANLGEAPRAADSRPLVCSV
jgi:hypothetical protein